MSTVIGLSTVLKVIRVLPEELIAVFHKDDDFPLAK